MSGRSDIGMFVRSLFSRRHSTDDYACRGPIFGDHRSAREAIATIPSRDLLEQPYVYSCIEGHWHSHVVYADREWRP